MSVNPPPSDQLARRRLLADVSGIATSIFAFAAVYGLAARQVGLSVVEAGAMSSLLFAGASQFAIVGYLAQGMSWPAMLGLTALVNSRHALYAAALAPPLSAVPPGRRAVMAHFLTDEAFALTTAHFRRVGHSDARGYWIAAMFGVFLPWNLGTIVGALAGRLVPDPAALGLDAVFPASMAGLAAGLVSGRRELAAASGAVAIALPSALLLGPAAGVVAGGLIGPALGLLVPAPPSSSEARAR